MSTAVLLSCHGTVERVEDLPEFIGNIRRGRRPPPEVLREVQRRYAEIGGSPLMRITRAQAEALASRIGLPVHVAGRLWRPYPGEVLKEAAAAGVTSVISLPLAPQSVEVYHASVREAAAAQPDLDVRYVPPWGTEPALIDAFDEAIVEAVGQHFGEVPAASVAVVLTAHSLPKRVIDAGDAYQTEFVEMATLVAARAAGRGHPTRIAFQSQGMTGDAWIGPDLPTTFAELVRSDLRQVLIAPIGFVADHVETLYDLDIEAQALARTAGVTRLARSPAMNTRPRFIDALEAVVRRAL
jgi:protoporphyrin/coproporphyrin ferrochelatase